MLSASELARALDDRPRRTGRNWMCRCPVHPDRTASFALRDGEAGVLFFCHAGCDRRDIVAELSRRGLWGNRDRLRSNDRACNTSLKRDTARPPTDSAYVRGIWNAAGDPRGTLAEKYLNSREIELDDGVCGRVLRFHPRCPFEKDDADRAAAVPALIAAFRPLDDTHDSAPQAIHRIGLTPDAEKISKMMLGPVSGCAVKLDPDDAVTMGLGICEGIETGLAIRAAGWRPVWALGSAGAIEKFPVLPGIEHLTIFADNDENQTGAKAAWQCAKRWRDAGLLVDIKMPKATGCDWADEWGVR